MEKPEEFIKDFRGIKDPRIFVAEDVLLLIRAAQEDAIHCAAESATATIVQGNLYERRAAVDKYSILNLLK